MPEDNNLVPQGGSEQPISTTEEVLRMLRAQAGSSLGTDALDNPELEQLFGSLAQGVAEIPESEPLTLEELAMGAAAARPARERGLCAACGARSPAGTRFCGMCGHELRKPADSPKTSTNGDGQRAAVEVSPEATSFEPEVAAGKSKRQGWKMAFLALLCISLGMTIYQQHLWWLPALRNLLSESATPVSRPPTAQSQQRLPAPAGEMMWPVPTGAPPSATPRPLNPVTRPVKPSAVQASSAIQPANKAAAESASEPGAAKPEALEHAPIVSMPTGPIELPTIIVPPHSSPVLESAKPVTSASETSMPKVSAGVVPGELIVKVNPLYPAGARAAHVEGAVTMSALIATDGSVGDLRVLSGNPLLVSAALDAVKRWRYRPFLLNGKPVEGETTVVVNFKAD